jgi:class 3 adenylate cyclase
LKSYRYEWRWRAEATPEQLWPLLADTNRTNRDIGLPLLRLPAPEQPLPPGTQRLAFTRLGVPIVWDEEPFEWVYPRWFSIVRRYVQGPTKEMRVHAELVPDGDGTEFIYRVEAWPQGPLGNIAIPLQIGAISARDFDRTFRKYIDLAKEETPQCATQSPQQVDRARLERHERELAAQVPAEQAQQLCEHIASADETELTHMRPYEFARIYELPRPDALRLFMHATSLGLLDLQWDLLCPRCRGAKQTQLALADVTAAVHCDACRIDFSADLPQQIELTFRPSRSVRPLELHEYCVGSPRRTPHILLQLLVDCGTSRSEQLTLSPGTYRLRTFATEVEGGVRGEVAIHVRAAGGDSAQFDAASAGWNTQSARIAPHSTLTLRNDTSQRQVVLLERTLWRDDALTAAEATATQAFRDLFASELLRPGESISVGTLTVVFTDLVGSTAFYRQLGDAPAFARVLDHFTVIRGAVAAEGGAVVKTMGDGVLAVFQSPAAALRAMRSAQRELASGVLSELLGLRVGMHSGPCIAVTLNDRLDYFGTTMNLAARLTALSDGSDIVLTQPVFDDPEVRLLIRRGEPLAAELKGLRDVPLLWRVDST